MAKEKIIEALKDHPNLYFDEFQFLPVWKAYIYADNYNVFVIVMEEKQTEWFAKASFWQEENTGFFLLIKHYLSKI